MRWTLEDLLHADWTVVREDRSDDADYIVLRIRELPGFLVAGSPAEVDQDYWDALEGYLAVALERGIKLNVPSILEATQPRIAPSEQIDEKAIASVRQLAIGAA